MSNNIFAENDVTISTYVGPENTSTLSRHRVMISVINNEDKTRWYIKLTMPQWIALCHATRKLGVLCEGPEID